LIEEDMMEEGLTERDIVAVQKAHMEIARPSILDAVRVCVQEYGAQDIVVAPYFLSKGRHIQEDIPYLVKEAEAIVREESGLEVVCVVAEPLGVDRDVVEVVKRRVDSCLDNKRDYQKLL
jgi:sirohydrochlorin ferrochelatase